VAVKTVPDTVPDTVAVPDTVTLVVVEAPEEALTVAVPPTLSENAADPLPEHHAVESAKEMKDSKGKIWRVTKSQG